MKWYELLSGLKINYGKCEFLSVRMEESYVIFLANAFGCKAGTLPSKYLGLPLCVGLPKNQLWEGVLEWIQKKLSSWKSKYLSMGRRITLIKSVLSNLRIYHLSCFKCPKRIFQKIEKLQREFLWNDSVEKHKYHLVKWDFVSKTLAQGGLGIHSIEKVNKALLGKWLWRVGIQAKGCGSGF